MRDSLSTPRDILSRTVAFTMIKKAAKTDPATQNTGDDMTLGGRIKIGMASKGIAGPSELARKLKLRRQTVTKWVNDEVDFLEPKYLFPLADVLGMNPRWLSIREGAPSPEKVVSQDDQRVLELYGALKPGVRDSWLKSGDALLTATGEPSTAQPFKHK